MNQTQSLSPHVLIVAGCLTLTHIVSAAAVTPTHLWSQRFGDGTDEYTYSVTTDAGGSVIVTGYFWGTVDFGGGNLTSTGGSADIFVAKFNAAGVHQWSQRFGDGDEQNAYSVTTDAGGSVIVTGPFNGTVDFGGGNLASVGGTDIFVAKFNAAGVHQWSQRFGDAGNQYAWSVTTDAGGNVIITGFFGGTVNFGGGNLTSAGLADIFAAKFNAAGVHQWSQRFGNAANSQYAYSVTTDAGGSVIVTGLFYGTVDFGGGNLASVGGTDIFVAKFNAAGVHQWSQRFGDLDIQYAWSVTTDAFGSVIMTGEFLGTVNFGGGNLASAGGSDIFVAKFNSAGVHQWSQRFGDAGDQLGSSVTTHAVDVIVTGNFGGTVDFGGGALTATEFSQDIFLAKFNVIADVPVITSILDVGNDQGRLVRILFDRCTSDTAGAGTPITAYEAYLRSDLVPLPLAPGGRLVPGWAFVGSVPAHGEDSYELYAPTLADSTVAQGQHYSVFFIRAATGTPTVFFDSPADSGYSLDNLAPGVPASFVYASAVLSWDESPDEDFDYFTVYGANVDDFGFATLVDHSVAPSLDVTSSPYVFYYVTATDFSGNEGSPAKVNTLSGVGGAPKSYVLSISAYPNPFNPETTIRYTLPAKGRVRIAVYDAHGARVRTLLDEERPAGAYSIPWDGRGAAGAPVSSGVYFARIDHHDAHRSYKMVLLK